MRGAEMGSVQGVLFSDVVVLTVGGDSITLPHREAQAAYNVLGCLLGDSPPAAQIESLNGGEQRPDLREAVFSFINSCERAQGARSIHRAVLRKGLKVPRSEVKEALQAWVTSGELFATPSGRYQLA